MQWDPVHNRLSPTAGPEHFKTYAVRSPLKTHWRRGTCEEVNCTDFRYGFVMTIDFSNDLGKRQLYYLTKEDKDRHYSMQRTGPYEVKLIYGPGTPCMNRARHRVKIGREPFYLISGGDWRGNPRGTETVRHIYVDDWLDDFSNHQDKISENVARG